MRRSVYMKEELHHRVDSVLESSVQEIIKYTMNFSLHQGGVVMLSQITLTHKIIQNILLSPYT